MSSTHANMFDVSIPLRVSALVADVPDVPLTTLDAAAKLGRGTLQKIVADEWGKASNLGGTIAAKVAALFGTSTDYVLVGGRKPAREDVRTAVERALRRAGVKHEPQGTTPKRTSKGQRPRRGSAADRSIRQGGASR